MTEQDRAAARRLAMIRHAAEVSGNVAKTCRYYGIYAPCSTSGSDATSRAAWRAFAITPGGPTPAPTPPGPRSWARSSTSAATTTSGPQDLDVPEALPRHLDQPSGIWRILKRLDMSRLPASQRYRRHTDRWKRYEKPLPGHLVQSSMAVNW